MSGIHSVWSPKASAAVKTDFDAAPLLQHLRGLERLNQSGFVSIRREIGEFMLGNIQDNFDSQRLFDGTAMPPSEAAKGRNTYWKRNNKNKGRVKGAQRAAGKTLIDKHLLYDSYAYQLSGHGVEIGSALIYSAIHHFGGETGRSGHRFIMKARPVLGVSAKQERAIGDYMIAAIGRLP